MQVSIYLRKLARYFFTALTTLRLYKREKLCSKIAIDAIFSRKEDNNSCLSYPIRAVWMKSNRTEGAQSQFLISVPKKRLRHAVDRVTMRRRIRESYRLNRNLITIPEDIKIDIAFIYVTSELYKYDNINRAMTKILSKISKQFSTPTSNTSEE